MTISTMPGVPPEQPVPAQRAPLGPVVRSPQLADVPFDTNQPAEPDSACKEPEETLIAAIAVRMAFSVGTLVSTPGLPSVVTRPKPVESALPVVLLYWGMLLTVVEEGVESEEPPLPLPQGAPASTMLPLPSHLAQLLDVPAVVALAYFAPLPLALLTVTTVTGRRAADRVPLEIFAAFVVSVVADVARPFTPLAGTEVAAMVPVPVALIDAPVPTTKAAYVFVPPASDGKLPLLQGRPASLILPLASHLAQSLATPPVKALANFVPEPVALLAVMAPREVIAVRTDFSVGTLVSAPGEPTAVTTPSPTERELPVALPNWGTLPMVVVEGVVMLLPEPVRKEHPRR